MKNYLCLIIVTVLLSIDANASVVDRRKAENIAKTFLNKKLSEDISAAGAKIRGGESFYDSPQYYIFNAEDGEGFVIVSGESDMLEVLAYSYDCALNLDDMHPALKGLLSCYSQAVDNIRNGIGSAEEYFGNEPALNTKKRSAGASKAVSPLCKCSWGQDKPYNRLCPQVDGKTCPTGCVATAMAQIMYYYQWPKVGMGKELYASGISGVGVIGSDFSQHYYDWEAMRATTNENLGDEKSASAVSQLCYDCGIATRMKYGVDGSSTNDDLAMSALYTYFGYKASKIDLLFRSCYATQDEWNDVVKSFLDNGSPVLYGGYSNGDGGHEFLIDGYNANGLFHVNWGWDGMSNGYYSIVSLAPSHSNAAFSVGQTMVCGFEPDYSGEDITPRQWRMYMKNPPTVNEESVKLNESFDVCLNNVFNASLTARTWTFAIGLYDKDDNQVAVITSTKNRNYTIKVLASYGNTKFDLSAKIPVSIPNGDYTLRAVFRQSGHDDFILPNMEGGESLNRIPLRVKDGVAYFNMETLPVEGVKTHIVKETYYFGLDGRELKEPLKGRVCIKREIMNDGSERVVKVFER